VRVIAIVTHPGNEELVKACRDTWASNLPDDIMVLEVYGGGEGQPVRDGDKLIVPCEEHYRTLPQKTWWLMKYLTDNLKFSQVLKCDDDVHIDEIEALFECADGDYCGLIVHCNQHKHRGKYHYQYVEDTYRTVYEGQYPKVWASGCSYILSNRAAHLVASTPMDELEDCTLSVGYEDAMVGKLMEKNNIDGEQFVPGRVIHYLDADGIRHYHGSHDHICSGDSYHQEGDKYFHSTFGKEKNENKAVEKWTRGAELGNGQGEQNLAIFSA
jgi:hypothetical protein